MVDKPPMTYIGTNGFNRSPGAHPAIGIFEHIMEGTLSGCDAWFGTPGAGASSNYGIGTGGQIHVYVDPASGYWAWANGGVNGPDADAQALVARGTSMWGHVSPNVYTISLEHEGWTGNPIPPAQWQASVHLTAWLCQEYGIAPVHGAGEDTIFGHYQIDSVTRPNCPGWSQDDWQRYVADVAKMLAGAPAPEDVAEKFIEDARKRLYSAQGHIAKALESLMYPPETTLDEKRLYASHAQGRIDQADGDLDAAMQALNF
jgi:hypothetical protein